MVLTSVWDWIAHSLCCAAGIVAVSWAAGAAPAYAAGDPVRGEAIYQGCQDCHSIDENDVGPMHRGVVGRRAGAVAGYAYSSALKNANIVWTEDNLDRWLTDPQKFVPGTRMYFSLSNPQDRADVIAFLKAH
jgi:cytochrome c